MGDKTKTIYHRPHKHYRPKNSIGGINPCKDYSMITDWHVSQIIFAKITETIGKTTALRFVSQSVIITEKIIR